MAERPRRLGALVVAGLCAALGAAPASAVVGQAPPADPAAWPWAVALLDAANPDPVAAELCTGTLIRGEWVLTAAHCVVAADGGVVDPAALQVGAGAADLAALAPDRRLPVTRVVVYPGYTPARFGRDVALLRLGLPSGLPPAALGAGFRTGSLTGWVAGFGLSDTGATTLLAGRISVSTPRACARYTRTLPASAFPRSPWGTVCGTLPSSPEPSACFGDSGGPLVDRRSAPRVVGIVSYGPGACGAGVTTVYSDVGAYRPWIARVTAGRDPALGLPEVRSLHARDAGRAVIARATWCQAGGRGHVLRAQFTLHRLLPSGRAVPALTRTLVGRAPGECTAVRTVVPDDLRNGAYEVRVKVIDRASALSSYGLPVDLRVS